MNPRKILVFFKTPTGKLLSFLVLVGLGLAFADTGLKSCRRDAGELTTRIAKATGVSGPVKTTDPVIPFDSKPTPIPASKETPPPIVAEATPTPEPVRRRCKFRPCRFTTIRQRKAAKTPRSSRTTTRPLLPIRKIGRHGRQ